MSISCPCHILQLKETPHTFIVKFRRKGPLSIDKTDIHNAQSSEPLQNMRGTVDGRNSANQLRLVVYPTIYRVLYFPGGFLAGFLNHQPYGMWAVKNLRKLATPCPNSGSHKRCGRPFVGYLPWTWIFVRSGETSVNLFQLPLSRFAEDWNQSQGPEHEIRRYDRIVQVTWMSNLDSQEILQPNQHC